MQVDDTKDKIYIHNLDDEIASVEAEESMIFLPDIEKKIRQIPKHILTGDLQPTAENQMVIYGVPPSLSVPKDNDSVRKAILECRARAREKQLENAKVQTNLLQGKETGMEGQGAVAPLIVGSEPTTSHNDGDAMDLG